MRTRVLTLILPVLTAGCAVGPKPSAKLELPKTDVLPQMDAGLALEVPKDAVEAGMNVDWFYRR